jgi:uncharacterized protein YndB with AHSA1/START domain
VKPNTSAVTAALSKCNLRGHAMIHFEHEIDIDHPIEEVFSFLADFTKIPLWNFYVQEVHQLTPGESSLGTRYDQIRRDDRQRYEITAHQRPHVIGVATLAGERPAFDRLMSLQATDRQTTHLHDRWELDTGHPQMLQRLGATRIRAGVGANLAVLKQLLEVGTAQLPDGRRTTLGGRLQRP